MSLRPSELGLEAGEQAARLERHARLSALSPAVQAAPGFRRVVEQLLDHGGAGFSNRKLQAAFLAKRKLNWRLSPEEFIAGLAADSVLARTLARELGPDQFTLLRTLDPGEFDDALVRHYQTFRTSHPPYDAGIAYPAHRYLSNAHVDLGRSRLRVLPMNAPVFDSNSKLWVYPSWSIGRPRANRSVAAVQLSRIHGDVPLDKTGRELFEALGIDDSVQTFELYLDPSIKQTKLQSAFMLAEGYSPIYRAKLVRGSDVKITGLREMAERTRKQARWQLAARLRQPELIDMEDGALKTLSAQAKQSGVTDVRPKGLPDDPFTEATTDELFAMGLREPGAPRVVLNTLEWEHHRSQRFSRRMDALVTALKLGPAQESKFRMLTGLCEPENLHLVTPLEHAYLDQYAAFVMGRNGVNKARLDYLGNSWVSDVASHHDAARAKDVLVAYEPRHLLALLSELHHPEFQRAAPVLSGDAKQMWNSLADQLNAAAEVYGMIGVEKLNKIQ